MNEEEIRQLQRIFGEDRVLVLNDKLSISKLPKLNELLVIKAVKSQQSKRGK